MSITIWEFMKDAWIIKKRDIVDLGIDPNKAWQEISLRELGILSDYLEVTIEELIN